MQKRHFETVAAALAKAYREAESDGERRGVYASAAALADAFADANPAFQRARFLRACALPIPQEEA